MTSVAAPPSERRRSSVTSGGSHRLRRVERWRWFVALAVGGAVIHAGAGHLVGVWLAGILIVGVHEAGHAIAARRLDVPARTMVIGIGPRIVRSAIGGLRIEVRAIPVVGWVEFDRERVPVGSLRVALVYAAGPVASLLLSAAVLIGGFAWFQGPLKVGLDDARYSVESSIDTARMMWLAPFGPVLDVIAPDTVAPSTEAVDGPDDAARGDAAGTGGAGVSSIVGITAAAPRMVEEDGAAWVLVAIAATSASVAGLNLLPAWGLDGHGILEECAWTIDRRSAKWGRRARRAVTFAGAATAALGLWLLAGAVWGDMAALV